MITKALCVLCVCMHVLLFIVVFFALCVLCNIILVCTESVVFLLLSLNGLLKNMFTFVYLY